MGGLRPRLLPMSIFGSAIDVVRKMNENARHEKMLARIFDDLIEQPEALVYAGPMLHLINGDAILAHVMKRLN
jgi:hypothetical protein